jgi:serine/threonine protein kinase
MKYKGINPKFDIVLRKIREYFLASDNSIWDKRNKLKVLNINKKSLIVKSFKVPHIINKIAYTFFRKSKAHRSYYNSLQILEFVPQPIGYAEFFKFALLYDSYFLSVKYAYDFTIREPLTQENFPDKDIIFKAFASFSYRLHTKGIEHLDYSPGNILIKKLSDKEYEFKIIDVNRMKFRKLSTKESLENFSKLWASDKDLQSIVYEYAKLIKMKEEEAFNIALEASAKHKEKKNLKKKLFQRFKRTKIDEVFLEKNRRLLSHISVVIMAKNADKTIKKTLDSLGIFDEVIVYLNHSTDNTESIVNEYSNVKVVQGDFLGFGATKNKASSYSKNDWILSLDSDEILTLELINEMMNLEYGNICTVYKLRRENYFLGKKTQNINIITRIYNRNHTSFDNSLVHEKIRIPENTKVLTLQHKFKHLYILTVNQTLYKIIHYTDLGTKDKKTCYFIVVIAKAIFAFFKSYLLEGNISKGWVGYVMAINAGNQRHYKYLKQYINCIESKKRE